MAEPIYGLELLDTQYADSSVRDKAVEWVDHLPMDDIIDLLPQLTQVEGGRERDILYIYRERERDTCVYMSWIMLLPVTVVSQT